MDAMRARNVAAITHPANRAVLADRSDSGIVAKTSSKAERCTAAEGCLATRANPSRIACALAIATAQAIARATLTNKHALGPTQAARARSSRVGQARSITRAAFFLAVGAPVARSIVADAQPARIVIRAMSRALHIAALPVEARIADAVVRVHGDLATMCARIRTARTHPSLLAICARGRHGGGIAVSAVAAVRARAVQSLAANAAVAWVARALSRSRVAVSLAAARGANKHASGSIQVSVARAAWLVTVLTPVAGKVVADAEASRSIVCAMARALHVAAQTHPTRVTDAVARVGGCLGAMHARRIAVRAHPWSTAVYTEWWIGGSAANTAVVAVWCARAVWDLTTNTSPALVALALWNLHHTQTVASAIRANARAARDLAEDAAETRQWVANARAIDFVTMTRALQVATRASPASLADTDAVDGGAMQTRRVAVIAHPASGAVDTHGWINTAIARSAVEALWHSRAHRNTAVKPSPVLAHARVGVCVACAVSIAVAVRARAARNLAEGAGIVLVARAGIVVAHACALVVAGDFAVGARRAVVAHAHVADTRARAAAFCCAVCTIEARIADALAQRSTASMSVARGGCIA